MKWLALLYYFFIVYQNIITKSIYYQNALLPDLSICICSNVVCGKKYIQWILPETQENNKRKTHHWIGCNVNMQIKSNCFKASDLNSLQNIRPFQNWLSLMSPDYWF